jgi:hypothetical protein
VLIKSVVFSDRAGGTALGGHRVAAHGIDLRDNGDAEIGTGLRNRDCGPQTGRAATHQQYIVGCSRAFIHHETPRPPESYRRASLPVDAAVVELYTRRMPQPQA